MTKKIYLVLFLAIAGTASVNAQMRISGSEMPNESAVLDLNPDNNVSSGNATLGLALPRVNLNNSGDAFPLSAHVKGMSVYNMATAGDVTPGVYVNDGAKWLRQIDSEIFPLSLPAAENSIMQVDRNGNWESWQSGSKVFEQTVTKPVGVAEVEIIPEISQYFPMGLYWCEVRLSFSKELFASNLLYYFAWQYSSIPTYHNMSPVTGSSSTSYKFSFPSFLASSMDTYLMFSLIGLASYVDADITLAIYRIL